MKRVIKYLIVLCVALLIVLIIILKAQKNKPEDLTAKSDYNTEVNNYFTKEKNEANEFYIPNMSIDSVLQLYYTYYKQNLNSDIEKSFNQLDEEYKKAKFDNLDEYREYIERNKDRIFLSTIVKYKIENKNSYNLYTCVDQFNNYFMIKETAVMQYTLILDNYTLDTTEFLERYNTTGVQGKTALNIQKFTQSLNAKDYKYAYNCLSDGFKENYFNSQGDFENYINNNWFNCNFEVEYDEFEEQSGLYKYSITIKNKDNIEEAFSKTIVMKLNEGTNFEMSFNV